MSSKISKKGFVMKIINHSILMVLAALACNITHTKPPLAYVTCQGNQQLVAINTKTYAIDAAITLPGANLIYNVAITPDNKFAYVTSGPGDLYVIDTGTNQVVDTITMDIGTNPQGVAITPNGKYVVVVNGTSNSVSFVSTQTMMGLFAPIGTPLSNPFIAAVSPDGTTAYITDGGANAILPINITPLPGAPSLLTPITVGTQAYNIDIAITADSNTAYVSNINDNIVWPVINLKSSPTQGTGIPVGSEPYGVVLSPDNKTLYVTNSGDNSLSIIDLTQSTPAVNTITNGIGNTPYLLAITADGNFLYIPNYGDGTLTVFDTRSNAPIAGPPIDLTAFGNPNCVAIMSQPSGPLNVAATRVNNKFLLQTDLINRITWSAPLFGNPPALYTIYRDPALTQLIATISASGPLQYDDHDRQPNTAYTYYIVSVDSNGYTSLPSSVTIAG
jgi:YVTN family beta-propeller protein